MLEYPVCGPIYSKNRTLKDINSTTLDKRNLKYAHKTIPCLSHLVTHILSYFFMTLVTHGVLKLH